MYVFPVVGMLALAAFAGSTGALAQQQTVKPSRLDKLHADGIKSKPLAQPRLTSSCTEFGAGFARLPGSDTCVRIGGSVSVGGGGRF